MKNVKYPFQGTLSAILQQWLVFRFVSSLTYNCASKYIICITIWCIRHTSVPIKYLKVVNLFIYILISHLFTLLLLLIKDTALELQLDLNLFNIRPDTVGSSKSFSDKYCLMVGSTPMCRIDISDSSSKTHLSTFFFILTMMSRYENIKTYILLL